MGQPPTIALAPRELISERTLDGLAAAATQGRKGGRPPAVDPDVLAIARDRRARGESVTAIANHLKVGRSTLYRALEDDDPAPVRDQPAVDIIEHPDHENARAAEFGERDAPAEQVP